MQDYEITIRGSLHTGSLLVRRCVELFGPPILTEHGPNRTFFMEFVCAHARAMVVSQKEGTFWLFHLTVNPEPNVSQTDWDMVWLALAPKDPA